MRLAYYPNRFPFRLVLSPCCQSCLQRTVEEHETLTSVCLFTRPRRPTGRTNREPSLKPAKRNNHNVSLEEKKTKKKKTQELAAVFCVFHSWVLIECAFSVMSHLHSFQWYVDLRCDLLSVSCMMSPSAHQQEWLDENKQWLFIFTLLLGFQRNA